MATLNVMTAKQQQLVENNLGLVGWCYNKLRATMHIERETDELIIAGQEALCRAAMLFNSDMGVQFTTYAVPAIRHSMLSYLQRNSKHFNTLSLDYVLGDKDDDTLLGIIGDCIDGESDIVDKIVLEEAIRQLPPAQMAVICRVRAGETQKEIGEHYGITRGAISAYFVEAIHNLRLILTGKQPLGRSKCTCEKNTCELATG